VAVKGPPAYSRFRELYRRWNRNRDVVLRHDHNRGDNTFVDWAGDTVRICDRESGDITPASIFVAVLGASTYTFACAALSQDLANWIDCHLRAFEFFLPSRTELTVPDGLEDEILKARTAHTRFGQYWKQIDRLRAHVEEIPTERDELRRLCWNQGLPGDFDVAQITWRPDYDAYYHEQLIKRLTHDVRVARRVHLRSREGCSRRGAASRPRYLRFSKATRC
jgi:hypothetical protein